MDDRPSLLVGRYSTIFRLYNRPRWRWKEKRKLRQYHAQRPVADVIKVNQSLELKPSKYPNIELRKLVEGSDEDGQFLVQYTTVEFEDKPIKLALDQRTAIESALKGLGIGGKRWLKRSKSLATAPEHPSSQRESLRNGCTDATRTSLELLSQTSDIFPPLKSTVGGVLAL